MVIVFGAVVLVAIQFELGRLVPRIGSGFFIATIVGLSIAEDLGLKTLQGSPEGWPIPTELGWYLAAVTWWTLWVTVVAIGIRFRRPEQSWRAQLGSVSRFLGYWLLASLALAMLSLMYLAFVAMAPAR